MYLTDYVKKFGQYSFKERPFNIVDALVFATAVYSNFEVVAPSIHDKITKETKFKNISSFDLTIVIAGKILVKENKTMIPQMIHSLRYRDVGIKYINKVFGGELENQFYGLCFLIPHVGTYIAFRGTDASILGWQEDFLTCIHDVIPSQLDALDYLHIISTLVDGPLYVGGHSKGGNLALYAAMNTTKEIQERIVNVYSFEGNGFLKNDFYTKPKYKNIQSKIRFVCPRTCIVGELFHNPKEVLVVKSKGIYIFQHNSHNWKINKETGDLVYAKERTKGSLIRHWMLKFWIDKCPKENLKVVIRFIVLLFGGLDKTIFYLLTTGHLIRNYRTVKKHFTKEERKIIKQSVKLLWQCKKEAKIYYKEKKYME